MPTRFPDAILVNVKNALEEDKLGERYPSHIFEYIREAGKVVAVKPKYSTFEISFNNDLNLSAKQLRMLELAHHRINCRSIVAKLLDDVERELGIDGLTLLAQEAKDLAKERKQSLAHIFSMSEGN